MYAILYTIYGRWRLHQWRVNVAWDLERILSGPFSIKKLKNIYIQFYSKWRNTKHSIISNEEKKLNSCKNSHFISRDWHFIFESDCYSCTQWNVCVFNLQITAPMNNNFLFYWKALEIVIRKRYSKCFRKVQSYNKNWSILLFLSVNNFVSHNDDFVMLFRTPNRIRDPSESIRTHTTVSN